MVVDREEDDLPNEALVAHERRKVKRRKHRKANRNCRDCRRGSGCLIRYRRDTPINPFDLVEQELPLHEKMRHGIIYCTICGW